MPAITVIRVDVIMAVHNAESTVEESVRSAMDQEIPQRLADRLLDRDAPAGGSRGGVLLDVCVCCHDDASTDGSLRVLRSLEGEWARGPLAPGADDAEAPRATVRTRLLVGTSRPGAPSRGAGHARNRAARLRRELIGEEEGDGRVVDDFLCILDSDDVMHSTRIAEQACAMLELGEEARGRTLLGCQFDRIPRESTLHYTQWANSLSDERLYLEQFRECTLLQPTWFLTKARFERLGGYLEAPPPLVDDGNLPKRAKVGSVEKDYKCQEPNTQGDGTRAGDCDMPGGHFYRLIHPSEIDATSHAGGPKAAKRKADDGGNPPPRNTLRLAEDTRLFHAHLHAGGRLRLHRTPSPLVSYRHGRPGGSQSAGTPRRLLLRLRARAWEDAVLRGEAGQGVRWGDGFAVWGAGRDGRDFLKALSPAAASAVACFADVDQRKIETGWYDNPSLGRGRIPIMHFSALARDGAGGPTAFGRMDKRREADFDITNSNHESWAKPLHGEKADLASGTNHSIEPDVLRRLPVVVCVAMYRTGGALERNVASIGRTEGRDLWHLI